MRRSRPRWAPALLTSALLAACASTGTVKYPTKIDERTEEPQPLSNNSKHGQFALVVGNAAYPSGPLRNPVHDADAMAAKLRDLGFDVQELRDTNYKDFVLAVSEFGQKLGGSGGVGLFYYSGHGLQVKGKNYLVPVDAKLEQEAAVRFETVSVNQILSAMAQGKAAINILILDACRNNPFASSSRSGTRGLAVMDAPMGNLIASATAPGGVAADGDGTNGVYTGALLQHLGESGQSALQVLTSTAADVVQQTSGSQRPWFGSSLTQSFYFNPGSGAKVIEGAKHQPLALGMLPTDRSAWGLALSATDVYWSMGYLIHDGGHIRKAPLSLFNSLADEFSLSGFYPLATAVNATHVYIAGVVVNDKAIARIPIAGGNLEMVATGQQAGPGLALYGGNVFWTNNVAAGTVMKLALNGGTPTAMASGQNMPTRIAVDATGVYWTNSVTDGSVMRVPLTGVGPPDVLASGQNMPWDIAVDATTVYWTNSGSGTDSGTGSGTVMKVAK